MMQYNFYEILGIDSTVTQARIRMAYIELATKYHPDRNPDDKVAAEGFTRVNEAYRVLSNPDSRYAYDLEIGISPDKEEVVPVSRRIEASPVTGSLAGDYLEEIAGSLPLPRFVKKKGGVYLLTGLDNPKMDEAYQRGLFSVDFLESRPGHKFFIDGMGALKKQEHELASAYFEELIHIDSNNILTQFLLGCCFEGLKRPLEAITQYKISLKIAFNKKLFCLSIREAFIILCLSLNRFEEALKECLTVQARGVNSTIVTQALSTIKKIKENEQA